MRSGLLYDCKFPAKVTLAILVRLLAVTATISLLLSFLFNAQAESLSRVQAEQLWRANNRDLKIAASAVAGAQGDLAAADRMPNPNVSLSTSQISTHTGIGNGGIADKAIDSVLRVEQIWERGGKRGLRARAGRARVSAARADASDAERQGLIQLYSAYWDLKLAFDRERLTQSAADLARQSAIASGKRLKVGDIAAVDFAKLHIDTLRAENDARSAIADREKSQYGLAVLIGRELTAPTLECADEWPPLVPTTASIQDAADVDLRADVKAASQRMEATLAARDSAKALGARDVTVGLQFERYPPAAGFSPNNTWGVSVAVPLFASRAYYQGELMRAEADLDATRETLARTRALAIVEQARALADLKASSERRRRLESELLPEAERVARANEFAYLNGGISLLDLLDARRTLRQTQQEVATARNDHAKALVAWQLQLPQPLYEPPPVLRPREITNEK